MNAWAVIVAGGAGIRMGASVSKQLLLLAGRTILEWTLDPFLACEYIAGIVIAGDQPTRTFATASILPQGHGKPIILVPGGAERQQSVLNALGAVPADADVIVVHDAVRPFIRAGLIGDCIAAARRKGAVSVMRPVTETIKVVADGRIFNTPDRSTLWITQTPQAFSADLLRRAHDEAARDGVSGTDDCMLVERLGMPVFIVEGTDENIKITTPTDLTVAAALLHTFKGGA